MSPAIPAGWAKFLNINEMESLSFIWLAYGLISLSMQNIIFYPVAL
jgi:hypothetical protein